MKAFLLFVLYISLFACSKSEIIEEKNAIHFDTNLPFLSINNSNLKSLSQEEQNDCTQILYCALKRAYNYIEFDTLNCQYKYKVTAGNQINMCPLLHNLVIYIIDKTNKGYELILKNNPTLKRELIFSIKNRKNCM